MRAEVLSVTGCPHHAAAVERLRDVLASAGLAIEIEEHRVADAAEAEALGLRGSPSVRIDGEDVEPATEMPSLCCRMRTEGLDFLPTREAMVRAIEVATRRREQP